MDFRRECQDRPASDRILCFRDQGLFASRTLSRGAGSIKRPTAHDQNPVEQDDGYVSTPAERWKSDAGLASMTVLLPNGSRLSCGRLARRRKGGGRQPVSRRGHNTPFPLERSSPASFKRLLGGPRDKPPSCL